VSTNRTTLALRRQSIRTLTADELRVAHGGQANANTTITSAQPTTGTTIKGGTCIPTRTTVRPTQTKHP
jgi:hypothetical protein